MRRLLLFRHAKAERAIAGTPDRERPLNERGNSDAAVIGAYMAAHAFTPDRALVSSATRTQQTWQQASRAFKPVPAADAVEELYAAAPSDILTAIKDVPAACRTLLVVAHNPGLHELALMLVASGDIEARERLREGLPTSGLVIIDFAFDDWRRLHRHSGRLERYVTPKSLAGADHI